MILKDTLPEKEDMSLLGQTLEKLTQLAKNKHGYRWTLMRFRSDWRCCLGTPEITAVSTSFMARGLTAIEAIERVLSNPDVYCEERIREEDEKLREGNPDCF